MLDEILYTTDEYTIVVASRQRVLPTLREIMDEWATYYGKSNKAIFRAAYRLRLEVEVEPGERVEPTG